jgi:hypothetical protein
VPARGDGRRARVCHDASARHADSATHDLSPAPPPSRDVRASRRRRSVCGAKSCRHDAAARVGREATRDGGDRRFWTICRGYGTTSLSWSCRLLGCIDQRKERCTGKARAPRFWFRLPKEQQAPDCRWLVRRSSGKRYSASSGSVDPGCGLYRALRGPSLAFSMMVN